MKNLMLCPTIFVMLSGFSAQAKNYYSPQSKGALIVFMSNADTVNAAYCANVEYADIISLARTMRAGDVNERCELLSKDGATLSVVEKNLAKIKLKVANQLQKSEGLGRSMGKAIGSDDAGKQLELILGNLNERAKKVIEDVTATKLFELMVLEAKSPISTQAKDSEIEEAVSDFLTITQ